MSNQFLLRRRTKTTERPNYLKFTALENGCTIALSKVGSPYDVPIEFSINGMKFNIYEYGTLVNLNEGDFVEWRRKYGYESGYFSKDSNNRYAFSITGLMSEDGLLTTLLKSNGKITATYEQTFIRLITNQLASAPLNLPDELTNMPFIMYSKFDGVLKIPSKVTRIDGGISNTNFSSILIHKDLTDIVRYSFSNMPNCNACYYEGTFEQWLNITHTLSDFGGSNPLEVAHNLYINNELITEVVFPNGITTVKEGAMYGASCITSALIIPNTVTTIGQVAFRNCNNIPSISIPNSLMTIGNAAFKGCSSLIALNIPNTIATIGSEAFYDCNIQNVYYDGTQYEWETLINKSIFTHNFNLYINNVRVVNVVLTKDSGYSFAHTTIESVDTGSLTSIGAYKLDSCKSLSNVNIREGVTTIGGTSFSGCTSLVEITIPSTVTSMGIRVFQNCPNLERVIMRPTTPPTIGFQLFNYSNRYRIYVPYSSDHSILAAYKTADGWIDYEDKIFELDENGNVPT